MLNGAGFKGRIAAVMLAAITTAPAAWSQTTLSATVTPIPAVAGATVKVEVRIDDVLDLYGFQFSLGFDSSVLRANTASAGSFLSTGGSTFFDPGSIDNASGSVAFVFDTLLDEVPGVSGSGTLASITFDVLRSGSSALTFSDVMLSNSNLADIAFTVRNGLVSAVPEPATWLIFGLGLATLTRRAQRRCF